jgi:hypothetical protein
MKVLHGIVTCCSLALLSGSALGQVERIVKPIPSDADAHDLAAFDDGYATIANANRNGQDVLVLTRHTLGGAVIWQRYLVGDRNDRAYCIETTRDGGFIIAGETDSVNQNIGFTTLIKTDGNGNIQWARAIRGTEYGTRPITVGLREDREGNYILVSATRDPEIPGQQGYAGLFNPAGAIIWSAQYRDPRFNIPETGFSDVRETVTPNGDRQFVVTGYSSADNTPRNAIALYLRPADGVNILTRSYNFIAGQEDHFGNGVLPISREQIRLTGRITEPQSGFNDDTLVWDVDAALIPSALAAVYDDFRVAHAAIEPSFTAVGVTTMAGHWDRTDTEEDAMLMTLSITPSLFVWANAYGRIGDDAFRGLDTRRDSILAVGSSDSFAGPRWIYTARTDPLGVTSCENNIRFDPRSPTPRHISFEMPRITMPVIQYRLADPRTEWFERVVCNRCPADFNEDGFLDFFDYDDYVNCFENNICPPGRDADFNGDGFVDFFDYDAFVGAFERGC